MQIVNFADAFDCFQRVFDFGEIYARRRSVHQNQKAVFENAPAAVNNQGDNQPGKHRIQPVPWFKKPQNTQRDDGKLRGGIGHHVQKCAFHIEVYFGAGMQNKRGK